MTTTSQTVICEEIFDDTSHPSASEIRDYASKIGIDPDSEPQLLPLAEEGLMKPLPPGWKPCLDDKRKVYYYHNNLTGKTQWEHPLDDIYRGLVVRARTESQSLSLGEPTEDATYTRDDLPSYEEPPPLPFGKLKKDIRLSPLKSKPKLITNVGSDNINPPVQIKLPKQKSEERPSSATPTRKINLSLFSSFDEKNSKYDKHPQKIYKQELTLTGGGSMFLKTNTKKENDLTPSPVQTKNEPQNQLRSILRENSRNTDIDKLASVDKIDREDDDKKSVRFNMESNPDMSFTFSDESESEESSDKNKIGDIINVKITNNKTQAKSRFSVFPVPDFLQDKSETSNSPHEENDSEDKIPRNLKLVKPDPTDFIKPELQSDEVKQTKDTLTTDSEDDSVIKEQGKNFNIIETSSEKDMEFKSELNKIEEMNENNENQQEAFSEQVEDEIQKYKDELYKIQKSEIEQLLMQEKAKHEAAIKLELENLKEEMENRFSGVLTEEKYHLESDLEKRKAELQEHFKLEEQKWERLLMETFDVKKREIENLYKERLELVERELEEKLEKSRDELIVSHNAILDQIKQNHAAVIDELQRDFKAE
ncbi:hypothetical protein ILUMI_08625, partial [Ignelater luminosus]